MSNTDHNTKVYNGLSSLFSKFVKNDFYLCALCFFSDKNYVNALTTVCRSIYINFFVCCSINFEFFSAKKNVKRALFCFNILKENVSSDRKALQRAVQKSESSASNISKYKRVHQNIMMRALNTQSDLYIFLIVFHFYDFNVEIGECAHQQKF